MGGGHGDEGHEGELTPEVAYQLIVIKCSGMAGILVITFLFAVLPYRMFRGVRAEKWLSVANCLSGGVFLGAGFLHMLAESVEELERFKSVLLGNYPTGYLFAMVAFLIIFLVEFVVIRSKTDEVCVVEPMGPKEVEMASKEEHKPHGAVADENGPSDCTIPPNVEGKLDAPVVPEEPHNHLTSSHHHHHHHHFQRHSIITSPVDLTGPKLLPYLIAIVLSLHAFLAGMALGSSVSVNTVIIVIIAIVAHKWSEAFAMGVSLVRSKVKKMPFFVIAVCYSLMTPLGIAVGLLIHEVATGPSATLASAILTSLAAGTFVYVACVEVLPAEFEHTSMVWLKFVAVLFGFAIMAVVRIWV